MDRYGFLPNGTHATTGGTTRRDGEGPGGFKRTGIQKDTDRNRGGFDPNGVNEFATTPMVCTCRAKRSVSRTKSGSTRGTLPRPIRSLRLLPEASLFDAPGDRPIENAPRSRMPLIGTACSNSLS